uniref:(northern house mosquito) hypothetical protein n=1 Tax=Culex pipiens TaxID=7175 RepID=A0A8D8B9Y0_CULPI
MSICFATFSRICDTISLMIVEIDTYNLLKTQHTIARTTLGSYWPVPVNLEPVTAFPKNHQLDFSHGTSACFITNFMKLKDMKIYDHSIVLWPILVSPEPVTIGHLRTLPEYVRNRIIQTT